MTLEDFQADIIITLVRHAQLSYRMADRSLISENLDNEYCKVSNAHVKNQMLQSLMTISGLSLINAGNAAILISEMLSKTDMWGEDAKIRSGITEIINKYKEA